MDMKNIVNVERHLTKQWFLANNFRYNKSFSDKDTEVYTYRFPVFRYSIYITLECELRAIVGENKIQIDVYDCNTRDKYAPFYYCEYGDFDRILKTIEARIRKELNKLGISARHIMW